MNLGRWQEPDPIGFKGGDFNLYRYVKNRFVVRIDPSGLYDRCIPSYASAGFGDNMEKTYTNDSCCEVLPNGNVKVNCGVPFYYIARFQCFGKGDDDPLDTLVKKNRYSIYQQICFGNLTLDGQKCPAANKCMDDTRDPNNTSPCDTISTPVGPYCYQDDCGVGECKGPYKIVIPWVQQNYYSIYMTLDDTPQLKGTFTAGQASKNVYEATFTTYIGKMSKEYCPSIGPNPPLFSAAPKKWKIAINVDYNGKDKPKCTATGSLL